SCASATTGRAAWRTWTRARLTPCACATTPTTRRCGCRCAPATAAPTPTSSCSSARRRACSCPRYLILFRPKNYVRTFTRRQQLLTNIV
ncbi:Protein of unknown function, partial [Gryllus bimaculatus]